MNLCPGKSVNMEDVNQIFADIRDQFLSGVPLKHFNIHVRKLSELIASHQEDVLRNTLTHVLNIKYPLKRSYQLSFLKNLIYMLESKDIEVIESVYSEYLRLLNANDLNEAHYVHYHMSNQYISIKEKTSFISNGTTGLAVWQAGKILGQYCIDNAETFRNKCILELGCGLGLTGIATVMGCKPKHYCFTDVHFEVLNYVVTNIKINFGPELDTKCEESNGSSELQFRGTYNDVTVSVINLPWEKNEFSTIYEHFDPDYILAADVVYDSSVFQPLSSTLSKLLERNSKSKAILSCTVRNSATLEEFFECLHEYELQETLVKCVETWDSSYSHKCEVRIFSVHHAEVIIGNHPALENQKLLGEFFKHFSDSLDSISSPFVWSLNLTESIPVIRIASLHTSKTIAV